MNRLSRWHWAVIALLGLTALGILGTRLVFGPVPWADGSAFYLPALELVHWPPAWKMHAQAAFVPSYDQANFNLMPALPLLLGIAARLGLGVSIGFVTAGPELMIRMLSLVALLAWAALLWSWLRERLGSHRGGEWLALAVMAAGLWDPVLRWGTLVVRTETWIGLCWLYCLRECDRWERSDEAPARWSGVAWRISAALALAAYFHFEAAYFVPAAVVGLGFSRGWLRRLLGIAWRTTALLSPWLLYVFLHPELFAEQMRIQFFRLEHANHWMSNSYLIFHSLFIEHGSPAGSPKFFNLAKGLFWLGLPVLALFTARSASGTRAGRRAVWASAVAFAACFFLWATKAEVWFITLCHLTYWSWVGASLASALDEPGAPRLARAAARFFPGVATAYALLSLGAAVGQARAIDAGYTWTVYQRWVDCIERSVSSTPASGHALLRLWQPHVPDVLVELSRRHPDWDLTRALDFPARESIALEAARRMDAILYTRSFNGTAGPSPEYAGPLRDFDRDVLSRGIDTPFGPWALAELLGRDPAHWQARVCAVGPFWSASVVRVP